MENKFLIYVFLTIVAIATVFFYLSYFSIGRTLLVILIILYTAERCFPELLPIIYKIITGEKHGEKSISKWLKERHPFTHTAITITILIILTVVYLEYGTQLIPDRIVSYRWLHIVAMTFIFLFIICAMFIFAFVGNIGAKKIRKWNRVKTIDKKYMFAYYNVLPLACIGFSTAIIYIFYHCFILSVFFISLFLRKITSALDEKMDWLVNPLSH